MSSDELVDILVEDLEDKGDGIGVDQGGGHALELVDVIELEVFQQQQQRATDRFHADFLKEPHRSEGWSKIHDHAWIG